MGEEPSAGPGASSVPGSALRAMDASLQSRILDVHSNLRRLALRAANKRQMLTHATHLLRALCGTEPGEAVTGPRSQGLVPLRLGDIQGQESGPPVRKRPRVEEQSCRAVQLRASVRAVATSVSVVGTALVVEVTVHNTSRVQLGNVSVVAHCADTGSHWASCVRTLAADGSAVLQTQLPLPTFTRAPAAVLCVVLVCQVPEGQTELRVVHREPIDVQHVLRAALRANPGRGPARLHSTMQAVICALPRNMATAMHARALAQWPAAVAAAAGLAEVTCPHSGRHVRVQAAQGLTLCFKLYPTHALVAVSACDPHLLAMGMFLDALLARRPLTGPFMSAAATHVLGECVADSVRLTGHPLSRAFVRRLQAMTVALARECAAIDMRLAIALRER